MWVVLFISYQFEIFIKQDEPIAEQILFDEWDKVLGKNSILQYNNEYKELS